MTADLSKPIGIAVLGATSAIAEATARIWAVQGARLFLAARDCGRLEMMSRDLRLRGAFEVAVWSGDLADISLHTALIKAMSDALGTPDAVLLAWGTLTNQIDAQSDPSYAAREIAVNFTAPVALLLALAPSLMARPPAVVACITSVAGDRGRASNFVYGAAKGGLQRFLEGYRHQLHGRGIVVLDIRPGLVSTPMTMHLPQDGLLWAAPERVAIDIARAVERRRAVVYTPWFWRWIMFVIRTLPREALHRTLL